MSDHLGLDALADVLADEPDATGHLTECADCRARLAELRVADAAVTAQLGGLPQPALPADVAARLSASLATPEASGSVTTLPASLPERRAASRWSKALPAAAAVVLVLAGAGYAISRLGGSGGGSASSTSARASGSAAGGAAAVAGFPRSSSGTDYTGRPDLSKAVPGLLRGEAAAPRASAGTARAPQAAAADPLARLRSPAGLADCLLALLPADQPSVRPLAVDYASFRGRPALVVLLPGASPSTIDVFVVGAGCSRSNDSTLFYTPVARS